MTAPLTRAVAAPGAHGMPPLRIGIVNLMPRAETYEATLLGALGASERAVEPVWLRLSTHAYTSSDRAHIDAHYLPLAAALHAGRIDTLLVSGAPIEDKRFDEITYWPELSELLVEARARLPSVLGLCWGALALAHLLGVEKVNLTTKLFGVFELENHAREHPVGRELPARFSCPQSRHSGLFEPSVRDAVASERARVLASSEATGATILESTDGRFLMHTGHPEYESERLAFEYARDVAAGRTDVGPPHGLDLAQPRASWRRDSESFFRAWLGTVTRVR